MTVALTVVAVWLLAIVLLLAIAWTRWYWRLRRRRRARSIRRSIDRAERALGGTR